MAALDVIFALRFWRLGSHSQGLQQDEILLRVAGSLWLMYLRCRPSYMSTLLLGCMGFDPWSHLWERLWHSPVVYWIVQAPPIRSQRGPPIYVGECLSLARRASEHAARILNATGVTQKDFYLHIMLYMMDIQIQLRCVRKHVSGWCFRFWLMHPWRGICVSSWSA